MPQKPNDPGNTVSRASIPQEQDDELEMAEGDDEDFGDDDEFDSESELEDDVEE